MPITHALDPSRSCVTFDVSGLLDTREMLAAVDRAALDCGQGRFNVLSDHRALQLPITTPQVKELVSHLKQHQNVFGGMRWAVVVGQPTSYGMMRMLAVYAEEVPIKVRAFTELEAAERWITSEAAES